MRIKIKEEIKKIWFNKLKYSIWKKHTAVFSKLACFRFLRRMPVGKKECAILPRKRREVK